ncbi:MAG: 5-formyltetrahydrofolate cyclo-ligase [Actinobacteria bacterium]|nr:5-formyltetrahydrofolate cyclo-ligase [Actinomycetota bacterium]
MRNNNPEPEEILVQKSRIRAEVQKKRDCLPVSGKFEKTKKITGYLFNLKSFIKSEKILLYYPFRSEIDTTIIINKALDLGKKVILPRVNGSDLRLYFVNNIPYQLEKGSYGIMEPIPGLCKTAFYEDIDLAIIPGTAFDRKLNRLGYGGGFYDRLLKKIPGTVKKISLAFDLQVIDNVPVSGEDIKIDLLITESGIWPGCEG